MGNCVRRCLDPLAECQRQFEKRSGSTSYDWAQFVQRWGYSIPDEQAAYRIKEQVGHLRFLDPMAGLGLWPATLRSVGMVGVASDLFVPPRSAIFEARTPFTGVEELDALDAVQKHDPELLVLVWPYCECPVCADLLDHPSVRALLYVGEPPLGRCGSTTFWYKLRHEWRLQSTETPRHTWPGVPEVIQIYVKGAADASTT